MHRSSPNIFRALRYVGAAESPVGVAEVARVLHLPISTAHRALATLEHAGYLRRLVNAKFELGPRSERLVLGLFRRFAIRKASLPFLDQLATTTGATASLCVPVGWYVIRLAVRGGETNAIRQARKLGEPRLLHTDIGTASLFVALSTAERAEYREFVRKHHRGEERDVDAAIRALTGSASRQRNYILSQTEGFHAFSFTVHDRAGSMLAAVAVEAPGPAPGARLAGRLGAESRRIVDALEALVGTQAEEFAHPFGHLPRKTILFAGKQLD